MSLKRWILVPAIVCLAPCGAAIADDYAQWRGPHRDGISQEKKLAKSWPKDGPKLLWDMKDAGYGFGAPAVVGGRMYLISSSGTDAETLQAYDVKDGKLIWSTKIGSVGQPHQIPNYPGARSTPTFDGDRVYVFSSDGDLVCLDKSGKMRWSKNVRTEYGGKPGIWAYAESPLVDGDLVICTPGGPQATLLALNKRTGALAWKAPVPGSDQAAYSSAVPTTIDGTRQYIQFLQKGLVGVDAKTGKFLWRFDKTADPMTGANIPTPVAVGGDIYTSSGMGGGGLCRVKNNGGTYAVEQVYSSKKLPKAIGGSVKLGDYLYGCSGTTLQCVDFKTGYVKWEERSVAPASIVAADGRLYLHGENGEVAMVEATPEGYHELGRFTPPDPPAKKTERAWAYPVISNGKLYIRDLGRVWCYDVSGR